MRLLAQTVEGSGASVGVLSGEVHVTLHNISLDQKTVAGQLANVSAGSVSAEVAVDAMEKAAEVAAVAVAVSDAVVDDDDDADAVVAVCLYCWRTTGCSDSMSGSRASSEGKVCDCPLRLSS
ncbi:hypothetical protein WICPIJ_002984 [Wickerhamomyces pijperi]|uniref:Uncharacterized protein n=1 Tax=Wickerhamomyces pijperi TaxID=599730 RepID=A0A9P8TP50_WICPI|nr:hypothetical protein WICPIJ_002984 [Wickerhamomyces pijperi]